MHQKKNTVLIVDADPQLQKLMSIILDAADFKIVTCDAGKQAVRLFMSVKPDLVLLDLSLPDMEGKDVISAIREWSQIPIIMLSARSDDDDVITALNLGANDYVIRPFSADVLLARINAALRSSTIDIAGQPEISNGPLRINLVRHEVYLNETLLGFTPKEYNLLRYFIVNRGRMLTHREILQEVWGKAHGEDTQYLRVFIGQIRAKIEIHPAIPKMIITEPGVGYRMEIAEILALPQSEKQQRAANS